MKLDEIAALPAPDRAEVEAYVAVYGSAMVLRVRGKLASEAKAAMLAYRKRTGFLPDYDFVVVES